MTEVPKIAVDRLRAAELAHAASGPSHPDADLLTAFAEQTLLPAERDGILQHLAVCNDCRDVVAMALPPMEPVASTIAAEGEPAVHAMQRSGKAERNWLSAFAWPRLRWAALAAGVIVAGSLLLLQNGNVWTPVPANQQAAISAPSASVPEVAPSMGHGATFAQEDEAKASSKSLSKKLKTDQRAEAPGRAMPGILIADAKRKTETRVDKLSPARPPALDSPAASSRTETVEVSEAAADINSAPSTTGNLIARNEAPAVEKAKPAPPEITTQQATTGEGVAMQQLKTGVIGASGSARSAAVSSAYVLKQGTSAKDALAPSFKLRIAAGLLQRSVDDGVNWQVSLHADHPLLCYAALNLDVWAGGKAGTLFHSTDGGVTWVTVQPAVKAQSLRTDVVSIKVQGPQVVLISTNNHETWTTADGGQTWGKK